MRGELEGDDDGLEVRGSRKEGKNVYNSTHGLLIHLENTEMTEKKCRTKQPEIRNDKRKKERNRG